MRKAFVVGHPIAHSRSPLIHGYWLRHLGIEGSYERVDVPPEEFEAFIQKLAQTGFAGGNVTIPHKEAAYRLADRLTPRAQKIGAVNTLVVDNNGILGDNTDAPGFIAHLDQSLGPHWLQCSGGTAVVLGAGGAARAVVAGLAERGIDRIVIANRSFDRACALVTIDPERIEVVDWSALPKRLAEVGLLVNTTSLGMTGHPMLELDLNSLPSTAAVADIVYAPLETTLLANARARGLSVVDGLGMLLHQAVPGFEAWFGIRPQVTSELRDLIVADLAR
ncbi:shikimate dehydrogenase [Methylobacterium brachythecii]|uniref:Shikimate dehydrogenase (NADP(+)) n=1 Tax=Methylobacterium brachythecii TaxID=1176177 RepID=A0A7W6AE94_9HYPH|nr:shikimate dehydrogenase [Methylobacterium brachythecii]MBB3900641.1 shikimate dehydrogenase [Methylobacterium brachythecii]GLS43518.1 shikimate dehydrogenase (NADP(+)) [Methylobacterium brachythecii]